MSCPLEIEMVRAVRLEDIPVELERHAADCFECREAVRVAQALRLDATAVSKEFHPISAAQIWTIAQQRRREIALARAALCVRILKTSGIVYALLFALWMVHAISGLHEIALPHMDDSAWNASIGGLALAAVLVGTGLMFALRGERAQE